MDDFIVSSKVLIEDLKDILEIDRIVYSPENNSTFDQVHERFLKNQEMFIVIKKDNIILGYICFFPISEKLYKSTMDGTQSNDSNILPDDVLSYTKWNRHSIYIISIAIHPSIQGTKATKLLMNEFFLCLEKKDNECYYIDNIVAYAVSEKGKKTLIKSDFKYVIKNHDLYEVYHLDFDKILKYDSFIMLPCAIDNIKLVINANSDQYNITSILEQQANNEMNISLNLKRFFLEEGLIKCYSDDYEERIFLGEEKCRIYLSVHEPTNLGVVIICLPEPKIELTYLYDSMTRNELIYNETNFLEYLAKYSIIRLGTPRSLTFFNKPCQLDYLKFLLSNEAYKSEIVNSDLRSPDIVEATLNNIAQFDFSEIYVYDNSIVEFLKCFDDDFCKRFYWEGLTIFLVEHILLQDASLTRVNDKITSEISGSHFSLENIQIIDLQFAQSTIFWNNDIYSYTATKKIKERLYAGFKIHEKYNIFDNNKKFLEHLIGTHTAITSEKESNRLNNILLFLTIISALPIFYEIYYNVLSGNFVFNLINCSYMVLALIAVKFIFAHKDAK